MQEQTVADIIDALCERRICEELWLVPTEIPQKHQNKSAAVEGPPGRIRQKFRISS